MYLVLPRLSVKSCLQAR